MPKYSLDLCYNDTNENLGVATSEEGCFDILRAYLLLSAQRIVNHPDAPQAIKDIAKRNVETNYAKWFELKENGIVYIDGVGPEMDYYAITKVTA